MFERFTDQSGQEHWVNIDLIMAVWASPAQQAMKPPQFSMMMACGTASEEWWMRGVLQDAIDTLRGN